MIKKMHFHLAKWHAVSTRLLTPEHWQAWANQQLDAHTLPETKPEVAFLPAMQRRRLSLSARLMFQAAHAVAADTHCPTIFVSHDGEINRSFELWQTLLRDNSVSPTSFGLSVHNALVGQWSIHQHNTSETSALAAQQDGWEIAITEAVALLHEGAQHVLVVAADEPLHQPIEALRAPFAYAVAALIEAGNTVQLQRLAPTTVSPQHYWGALDWVKQQYLHSTHFVQHYSTSAWQWQLTT